MWGEKRGSEGRGATAERKGGSTDRDGPVRKSEEKGQGRQNEEKKKRAGPRCGVRLVDKRTDRAVGMFVQVVMVMGNAEQRGSKQQARQPQCEQHMLSFQPRGQHRIFGTKGAHGRMQKRGERQMRLAHITFGPHNTRGLSLSMAKKNTPSRGMHQMVGVGNKTRFSAGFRIT